VAKLRAAVLAAGRGVRMGGNEVKSLVPLGDGEPLMAHILRGLKESGVEDVLVVTGFRPDEVQRFCNERGEGLSFTYVFNARYASWGNFHSLRLALDQSPGYDVLVVNSDVVVDPGVYGRAAGSPGELVLAVQRRHRLDEEDMKVELSGRRVVAIGKHLKIARSHGEFTGISLIRPEAALLYQDACTRRQWSAHTDAYYEDVYADILDGVRARAVEVGHDEYAEVDTPQDVPAAEAVARRFYRGATVVSG